MAANLLPPFNGSLGHPIGRSCPDQNARKASPAWWTPLFGWSSEPDYLESVNTSNNLKIPTKSAADKEGAEKSRLRSVRFTEEKARLLRMMTTDAGSFHHEMYHSAIAARLASDFGDRSDQ